MANSETTPTIPGWYYAIANPANADDGFVRIYDSLFYNCLMVADTCGGIENRLEDVAGHSYVQWHGPLDPTAIIEAGGYEYGTSDARQQPDPAES